MAARKLSDKESDAYHKAERERRIVEDDGIKISEQPDYGGPEVLGFEVGPHRHTGPARGGVRVTHDSGRVTVAAMIPAWMRAWVYYRATGQRAVVRLVVDRFGTDDGGDLRLDLASFEATGEGGGAVPSDLLENGRARGLLALAIKRIAHAPGDHSPFITWREALDYIEPGRMREHDPYLAEMERIARVWWDAKLTGAPVGYTVARARGTDAPRSAKATGRAHVYVAKIREAGVLAAVGRDLGYDLERYLGRGKHGQ